MDDSSFDTLLDRVIEEVRADPAARDKLLRALLPLEILRLPEEVVDIKRLLERTIQTQEELSVTATQLSETQAGILKTQEMIIAELAEVKTEQKRIAAEQTDMRKTLDDVVANQAEMRETLDDVVANQEEMRETQKHMLDDIGALKGESLEMRLEFRLVPKLRQQLNIRRTKVMHSAAGPSSDTFF